MSDTILIVQSNERTRNELKRGLANNGRRIDACAVHELPQLHNAPASFFPEILVISHDDTKKLPNGSRDLLSFLAHGLQGILLTPPHTAPEESGTDATSHFPPVNILRNLQSESDLSEILQALQSIEDQPDPDFIPIPVEEIYGFSPLRIELFIRLPEDNFVKLFQPGSRLESGADFERLESYRQKGLEAVWVKKDDFITMVGLKALLPPETPRSESGSSTGSLRLRQRTLQKQISKVLVNELSKTYLPPEKVVNSKVTLEAGVSMLAQREQTLKFLESLSQHSNALMTQVLVGTFFALLIARQLGWSHPGTLFHLTIACLLRDIGMTELEPQYVTTAFRDTDAGTRVLYESHPGRSHELLLETGIFPETVLRPILQHHEACDGNGFPYQLKKSSILPVARLMSAADAIAARVLGLNGYGPALNPVDAVAAVKLSSEFDPAIISAAECAFGTGRIP